MSLPHSWSSLADAVDDIDSKSLQSDTSSEAAIDASVLNDYYAVALS